MVCVTSRTGLLSTADDLFQIDDLKKNYHLKELNISQVQITLDKERLLYVSSDE